MRVPTAMAVSRGFTRGGLRYQVSGLSPNTGVLQYTGPLPYSPIAENPKSTAGTGESMQNGRVEGLRADPRRC
jgi:hypothetical protein